MNNTNTSYKWSLPIFHPNIYTHSSRNLLFIPIKPNKSMNIRSNSYINNNGYRLSRICITMRSNILLRCYRNHRSSNSNSISRKRIGHLNLGRSLRIKPNTKSIFFATLHLTHSNHNNNTSTPNYTTRKRILKPIKYYNKHR